MYQDVISGFRDAFESISTHKSGKEFEKSLISSQIENEFSDSEDRELINIILYPHFLKSSKFNLFYYKYTCISRGLRVKDYNKS